jgi:hypothetical protein
MSRKISERPAVVVARMKQPGLHFVGGAPGLALQVTATGARSWILRVTIAGKRRDMGLGTFGASPTPRRRPTTGFWVPAVSFWSAGSTLPPKVSSPYRMSSA